MSPVKATACIVACLAASCGATAQQQLPLWELGAVGFAASTPAYPGASDRVQRGLAVPYFIYRGKVFRADQEGVGARLFSSDRVELDVGLAGSLPASSDDVAIREGMPDLGTLIEFGPRLNVTLGRPTEGSRIRLQVPLRAVIELRGGARRQGTIFEPSLSYEMRGERARWTMSSKVSVVAGDRKIQRYFYEVAPAYATAERPAYAADGGMMLVRLGLSGTRLVTPDVRLFGYVRYENYASSANRDSPLLRKSSGASIGGGFAWTLRRSSQSAR